MYLIGVTGKSGSGKSEICNKIGQKLNCEVIRIDKIGHFVVEQKAVLTKLIKHFGKQILDEDGSFSRKKLGALVFFDENNMKALTDFTLPEMIKTVKRQIAQCKKDIVILDYILLPILPFWETCNLKILINCPQKLRFSRIIKRDNVSLSYIKKRESASLNYSAFKFDKKYKNIDKTEFNFIVEDICKTIKTKMGS